MAFDGPDPQDAKVGDLIIRVRQVETYEVLKREVDGWTVIAHTTDRKKAEMFTEGKEAGR